MQDDWILDVLADLADFARTNHLEALAFALDRARSVALVELSAENVFVAGAHGAGSRGAHSRKLPERPGP